MYNGSDPCLFLVCPLLIIMVTKVQFFSIVNNPVVPDNSVYINITRKKRLNKIIQVLYITRYTRF